ncbi:GNAT family N-acetyltransferase [Gudongella sp. DL1XJH-153]|uniref:GNAT family N-acetyltransferase n=1 Tax=Gudongella sp. DL1XJH-153 TaxID=3409804 RepID=UPI003BB71AFF
MIEKLEKEKWQSLIPELMKHTPENYFNLLGLLTRKPVYKDIYVQRNGKGTISSYLFHRLSGTVKFFSEGDYDIDEMADFIQKLQFNKLIGPLTSTKMLEQKNIFRERSPLTYLCELVYPIQTVKTDTSGLRRLEIDDLSQVVEIYLEVFKSFASEEVMENKLKTGRGRAFGLFEENRLVSVVQTDFEQEDSALIVGVATRLNQQNHGYGTKILSYSIEQLQAEGKTLYLEYESPDAGNLYKRLGFKEFETIMEYLKH